MTGVAEPRTALLAEPHHDGSDLCVLERPDELGGEAVVRLRVPHGLGVDAVVLRYVADGEPRAVRATVDAESEGETWWRASFPAVNPTTSYRWLLSGDARYTWLNGTGIVDHDLPDDDDFLLSLDPGGPGWHTRSVVYEIFPDRFASSGIAGDPPNWVVPRAWDELPTGRGPETPNEWFGGDLRGIEQRLDHVEGLGANVVYLTPVFPAGSTHRYDASSFDRVDPLLGGDEAFASLVAAAHARGIRVVGDLTTNHAGAGHEWFRAARERADAEERAFFWFDDRLANGYESWWGVPALPKLNWGSRLLGERMQAVARRWLDAGLDGWRIDVANMTGRRGDADLALEAARLVREAAGEALLVAEHAHDFRRSLAGGGWHGAMNYAGFTRPVWCWLRGEEPLDSFFGLPVPIPRLPGGPAVATMRAFRAGVPWPATLHSWTLLDSHDTARFRTVAGSRDRQLVGVGLQMTTPGVPMIFAGDELGLEGAWGEDSRRTMPWSRRGAWDEELLDRFRRLVALRRSSDALARGGIRYAHVGVDEVAYLRESPAERLLCLASRDDHEPVRLPLAALGCAELETLAGGDAELHGGEAILPAGGPSFHVWRLRDG